MHNAKFEREANALAEAIVKLASNDDALNNFASYLSYHFPAWLEKYANTVDGVVDEFQRFASVYDDYDDE